MVHGAGDLKQLGAGGPARCMAHGTGGQQCMVLHRTALLASGVWGSQGLPGRWTTRLAGSSCTRPAEAYAPAVDAQRPTRNPPLSTPTRFFGSKET